MAKTITLALLAAGFQLADARDAWTVNCAALTVQRSDPIMNPGVASGHVHSVVGSSGFSRQMGPNDAKNGLTSTCDKATDHSNYWAPQLYSMQGGKFTALKFTGMAAYYERFTCDYSPTGDCPGNGKNAFQAFPDGLRMLAGNSERRTYDASDPWQKAILTETGNDGEHPGMPKVLRDRFSAHIRFPSCWDGKNLDSANHQDHVSYPSKGNGDLTQGGMCPPSHPHAMPNIGAEFGWDIPKGTTAQSLVWANGDTTGYGIHADFIMGWQDRDALRKAWDTDAHVWDNFQGPGGKSPGMTPHTPQVAVAAEDVGLNGPINALPGNNPVHGAVKIKGRSVLEAFSWF